MENGVLPKVFLDFLNIRHFPSVPKTESCGWVEAVEWKTICIPFLKLCKSLLPYHWKAVWLSFYFSSLRSFDTESEESRWAVSNILFVAAGQSHYLLCCWTSPSMTLNPPACRHRVCLLLVAAHKPSDFSFLCFSVNFHISQSCCFSETPTCCRLLTVSSGCYPYIPLLYHSYNIVNLGCHQVIELK